MPANLEVLTASERRRSFELVRGALPVVAGAKVGSAEVDKIERHVLALEQVHATSQDSRELERLLGAYLELMRRLEPIAEKGATAVSQEAQAHLKEAEAHALQEKRLSDEAARAHALASKELDLREAGMSQLVNLLRNPRVWAALAGGAPLLIALWEKVILPAWEMLRSAP